MKKLLVGLFVVLFIGIIGSVVSINATGGLSFNTVDLLEKKEVKNEEIKKIDIDFPSTDIEVQPSDDDSFIIEVNGRVSEKLKDKFKLNVEEQGDLLKVEFQDPNTFFNIGVSIVDTTVSVYLPTKVYESVTINTASGNIEAEQLNTNQLNVSAASGNIKMKDMQAEKVYTSTASGNITVDQQQAITSSFEVASGNMYLTNVVGNVTAHSSSGNITLHNEESSGNISANALSGNVKIEYEKAPSSLYINFKATSGNGKVELDGVNYEEKSNDRIIGTIGSGDHEIIVDITSGNFKLQ
ncbi:DUF4097 family beta strand repeat-containing protein [Cytobacillus sp. IB215316]|uniref:DUF4097 family beta strand repeat-containing protein n=1 Tax=Cytobacillus sp. IB215316 TaxID=3097354 RepID=UPI002A0B0C5C|nr:DUF4097 family beta strand repeat-containing protein [Cytobacillus sp. IB215316]MDX8363240.1 DUF4097 family beta strand repeat-containing protein [Cytobacillus sp. IB215316]